MSSVRHRLGPLPSNGISEGALLQEVSDLAGPALERVRARGRFDREVESSVEAIAHAIDARDSYTSRHSDEVVELATIVGGRLGLDRETLGELQTGARLHDVGKIAIPDSILQKQASLDTAEWEVMKQHPVVGSDLLERVSGLERVARIVRSEHERWDGTGYPDGLRADQIPLASRIIFVCDAYHAMTSDRPYREALRPSTAVSELRRYAGLQFDPNVVETLILELRSRSVSTRVPGGRPVAGLVDGERAG
ncbi:MAG: HD-GYP domain-containing protein [Solirubrobacterales bacterium]